ncbi:unnamed protein product [Peniophora sp. CBMAI 1063]|nr:unnamed protein product [Peniophora sp. CBMAI 1063]
MPSIEESRSKRMLEDLELIFSAMPELEMLDEDYVFMSTPTTSAIVNVANPSCIPLRADHSANYSFLQRQACIWDLHESLDQIQEAQWPDVQVQLNAFRLRLDAAWLELLDAQRQAWISQAQKLDFITAQNRDMFRVSKSEGVALVRTERYMRQPLSAVEPILAAICIIAGSAVLFCGVSLAFCRFFLKSMRLLLGLSSGRFGVDPKVVKPVLASIPVDSTTALKKLDLAFAYHAYVCCPACFAPYANTGPGSYPETCVNVPTGSTSACQHSLMRHRRINGRLHSYPARQLLLQNLKEWLGRFLCRPGIMASLLQTPTPKARMSDLWDAPQMSAFIGPDGSQFLRVVHGELRLVFALNVDGFNPFQAKETGRRASVTAMYLICLNLPPHLRYKVENMFFIGLIPGPKEPTEDQINHILALVVQQLLEFWTKGVFYDRTPLHDRGLLVRLALFLVVCDSPAGRDVSGFARHNHTRFCPYCKLTYQERNNVDYETWVARTLGEHRACAEAWRAGNAKEKSRIWSATGIRYSALLELPYWDPLRCTVIDMMHALLLGNLKRLVRLYWNMSASLEDGDGTRGDTAPLPPHPEMLDEIWRHVRASPRKALSQFTLDDLRGLVRRENIAMPRIIGPRANHKITFVDALVKHRIELGWFNAQDERLKEPALDELPHDPLQVLELGANPVEIASLDVFFECAPDASVFFDFTAKVLIAFLVYKMELPRSNYDKTSERYKLWGKRGKKKALVKRITELRFNAGFSDAIGNTKRPDPVRYTRTASNLAGAKNTAILGKRRLAEVWADMDRTITPTWVGHAPHHIGDKQHRKVGADDYRIFITINLVVTMVRLWGPCPLDSRERALLDNFMALVTATNLASSREIDNEVVEQYFDNMLAWIQGLIDLFPGVLIESQQHLSLHLPYFLLSLGPTHAWRCFVFERWNFLLQQINTNNQFGSLERTMFERFIMNQLLRAALLDGGLTAELQGFKPIFEECFESDKRGTMLSDFLSLGPDEDRAAPLHPSSQRPSLDDFEPSVLAQLRNSITRSGAIFLFHHASIVRSVSVGAATFSVNSPDCYVAVGTFPAAWRLGKIVQLITYSEPTTPASTSSQTFVAVRYFKDLLQADSRYDWYRDWPLAAGKLHYAEVEDEIDLVALEQVICHCCVTEWETWSYINRPVIHALPLNR